MRYKLKGGEHHDIIKLICENRNMTEDGLKSFLNPTKDSISNPLDYLNMEEAIRVFAKHMKNENKVTVLVDSDTDGYCSSATLINYMKVVFPKVEVSYILHEDKAHGLTDEVMEELLSNMPDLVIIPDASSGDAKQHKVLKDVGIDVIVLDHHEFGELSQDAIVVTNQIGEVNNTLSGGGMVIDKYLNIGYSEYFYDLVGASLVADSMMMSQPETRYYVTKGLENINNPLLKALVNDNKDKNFDTISYNIAPTINAFIRVGEEEEKRDLFKALIGVEEERDITIRGKGELTMPLNQYIATMSSRIKSRQNSEIKRALEHKDLELYTEDLPIVIALLDENTRASLTGLIANRLVNEYNKPALVLRYRSDGKISGSGRSTNTFNTFKDYMSSSKYVEFCVGHQSAFGCGFESKSMLFEFMHSIKGVYLGEDSDVYIVDKAYLEGASAYDIMAVDELKNHWCRGFERPMFYVKLRNVSPSDLRVMGRKNDTICIKHNYISYIKFKCTEEEVELFNSKETRDIEIIGVFNVNEFNGTLQPQVEILNIEYTKSNAPTPAIPTDTPFGFGYEGFEW